MVRKFLYLTLSIALLLSLVACNETLEDTSYEEEISNNEEEIANSDKPAGDLIEMRGTNLRMSQKQLDRLSLDGEHYVFSKEALAVFDSSHINLNYPLIFDGSKVYNLEEEKVLFTVESIVSSLEKEWEKVITTNDVFTLGDNKLEADFFQYIDSASLSSSTEKVAFSVHYYFAATFISMVGVVDMANDEISFVEGPFNGQITEVSWSPDEKYFAYIISSIMEGDESDLSDLYLINAKDFIKTTSVNLLELFEDEMSQENYKEDLFRSIKVSQWLENGMLNVQLKYVDKDDHVKDEFNISIDY